MLVGEGVLDAADIMFLFATLAAVIAAVNAISLDCSYEEGDVFSPPVPPVTTLIFCFGITLMWP